MPRISGSGVAAARTAQLPPSCRFAFSFLEVRKPHGLASSATPSLRAASASGLPSGVSTPPSFLSQPMHHGGGGGGHT